MRLSIFIGILTVSKLKLEKQKSTLREYTEAIVIALLLALFVRTFIVQAFKIPSGSMLPTLKIGDYLLVNKFIYGIKMPFTGTILIPVHEPKPNDIVVFKFPKDPRLDYIKRVIGVPGDQVEIRQKKIFVNGKPFADRHGVHQDPMILPSSLINPDIFHTWEIQGNRDQFGPIQVPEGKIFVMGDNRDNSYDSRFWGLVDQKAVLGKALIIYWSWDVKQPFFSLARFASIRWNRLGDVLH